MAQEDDLGAYKDISELKKELDGMKAKKDIPPKELYDAVQKLTQTMSEILDIFGAAAEQMKLEEKEYESENKKHEMIISKLDKLLDQNKTIAEGMVAIVELVKQKLGEPAKEREEHAYMPKPEPRPLFKPIRQEWQPKPEPVQRAQPALQPPPQMSMPPIGPPPDFGLQMPPMQPEPFPNLDLPDELSAPEEESKKKGLFGMFKK